MPITIDCGEGRHTACCGSGSAPYLIPQDAGEDFPCGCLCHVKPRFTDPVVQIDKYLVSPFPADHPKTRYFSVTVERRGGSELWSVYQTGYIFVLTSEDGENGDFEPAHSGIAAEVSQFSLGTAMALAKASLPIITVNGYRADGSLWHYPKDENGERQWVMVDPPGTYSHYR